MTGLIYDARFLEHDPGPSHPDQPGRLQTVMGRLEASRIWPRLRQIPFEPAGRKWIERIHTAAYIDRLYAACEAGERYIDSPECAISPLTAETARLAAGGVLAAVDAVMAGEVRNAFCAVRPPGHHAEADRAMGFCFFNHVAIAAEYLVEHHGLERVAVVDFDVHHANGTQHSFESRDDVMVISLHEHPDYLYPGTGRIYEIGVGEGSGATLNIPLDPEAGDAEYREAFLKRVIPVLDNFRPQFVLLSTGFDAAEHDQLAHMRVSPHGFEWMTAQLKAVADRHAGGRLVSVLEGGYNPAQLGESTLLHVATLLEDETGDPHMAKKAGL
ncbi:MAG: histone deacetylase [Phycisphaeraceae bacterium]